MEKLFDTPNTHTLASNFFHGKWYKSGKGDWKTYKTNPKYKTTIELIRMGIRTQTTRNAKSCRIKIGDFIEFVDEGRKGKNGMVSKTAGQKALVLVTNLYPPNKEDFIKKEGWAIEVFQNLKDSLMQSSKICIEFEFIK